MTASDGDEADRAASQAMHPIAVSSSHRVVEVVEYQPTWARDFEDIRDAILHAVKDSSVGVEHVGSTSVPGLYAKPIIDLDVIVLNNADFKVCITNLTTMLGYIHKGELGIEGRHAFKAPVDSTLPRHNLYVCIEGSVGLVNHLLVREYLRSHPLEAKAYGVLKQRLAENTDDSDAYCQAKTDFLVELLTKAGLDEDIANKISAANKES